MSINICPMVALAAELTNVPLWLCIPFACLLLCIAIIPLVKGEWWENEEIDESLPDIIITDLVCLPHYL